LGIGLGDGIGVGLGDGIGIVIGLSAGTAVGFATSVPVAAGVLRLRATLDVVNEHLRFAPATGESVNLLPLRLARIETTVGPAFGSVPLTCNATAV
jgi:hypothetical protein